MTTTMKPWTDEQLKELQDAVAETKRDGRPISDAFEQLAKKRGTSPGSVQSKWYALNPGGRKKRKRRIKVSDSVLQQAAPVRQATKSYDSLFEELPWEELIKLSGQVTREMDRRVREHTKKLREISDLKL